MRVIHGAQKVKKMEQEMEALRSSSGVASAVTSVSGSIEDNIDMLSVPATSERRTESMESGSSGPVEAAIVSPVCVAVWCMCVCGVCVCVCGVCVVWVLLLCVCMWCVCVCGVCVCAEACVMV